jgi:hypothetical protein
VCFDESILVRGGETNDEFIRYIYLFIKTWIEKLICFFSSNDRNCSLKKEDWK